MSFNRNFILLSFASAVALTAQAFAQPPAGDLAGSPAQRMTIPEATAPESTEVLTLTVNKSYMIEFDADIGDVIIANERGTFLPIKHVVPTMIAQRSGKIVNIGGTSGLRGYPMRTAYSASKWAVRGITRTVALELGKYNINVNAVCPGIVETPRMMKLCEGKAKVRGWTVEQVYEEYVQDMALKRVTLPEDVANAVLFMASDDSRQITGQHIAVDGGWDV